jgi:S1-C subfamily serine protease
MVAFALADIPPALQQESDTREGVMRENRFFVRSTELAGHAAARVGEAPAILSYADVIERIAALASSDAAALFAEPVLPRGVTSPGTTISWYSPHEGAVVELDAIDDVARKPVAERLAQRLAALSPALADVEIGPILSAWLNITSPKDILSVGGEPVLVNWGFLPGDKAATFDHRREHFARTLGRFAPQLGLPAVDAPAHGTIEPAPVEERAPRAAAVASAASERTAAPATPRLSIEGGAPPGSGGPPRGGDGGLDDPGRRRRPWLAPIIATALAGMVLLLLLVPGVLVYPAGETSARDAFEADRLRASNESLEGQLQALQGAARDRVCRSSELHVPVPQSGSPGGPQGPDLQMELIPRSPERVAVPPTARTVESGTATVAELLESTTVLVLGLKPPNQTSQGTGFFISDRHIVTNHHVIAGVDERLVFVASQALGGARHAKVVAKSAPPPTEQDLRVDLAVLEIEPVANHAAVKLGTTPPKLSTAYVSGYPNFLLMRDTQFQQFQEELVRSLQRTDNLDQALARQVLHVPGADLRSGRINNVMNSGGNSFPIVVHDMQLAQGNSGGPLVDACGRLGGVNTLLFTNSEGSQQGNVAQDVSIVRQFLTEQSIAFQSDDTPCQQQSPAPPQANSSTAPPPEAKN